MASLSKEQFTGRLKEVVSQQLADSGKNNLVLNDVEVIKINDQILKGFTIKEEGAEMAATFYIDSMYEDFIRGADIEAVASGVVNTYEQVGTSKMPKLPQVELKWGEVKDKLGIRLLDVSHNKRFLESVPHQKLGYGLAVIADISYGGEWRINVTNDVVDSLGVDSEVILNEAIHNSPHIDAPVLHNMTSALAGLEASNLLDREGPLDAGEIGGMYVLTNESMSFGAATLFYPGVKEKAAEVLGSDYYILPSSVHEVILVPDDGSVDPENLFEIVKSANSSVVKPEEFLAGNVYHYNKNEKAIDRAVVNDSKKVYISINKKFCYQGESKIYKGQIYNKMTLPKGTFVDGKDIGGKYITPMYMKENQYNPSEMTATYYVDPSEGLKINLYSNNNIIEKVDVEELNASVETQKAQYKEQIKEKAEAREQNKDKTVSSAKEKDSDEER